ncbi:MAG: cation-translocating P-type ATPase, partial [Chloroflexota bacterium]|nr:cation-translocating P-type ATPase [Chloroflexota bacterium]
LTGESVPVRKIRWDGVLEMGRPGGDDLPFVYSGTLVVKGRGIAQVHATGVRTEIGKIGKALKSVEPEQTSLQKEITRLVRGMATAGLALCAVVVIVYGMTRGNWLDGFLAGIAMAMAMLPEEFPVVLTIFLALGAWRISQKRVLTRRVPAIETLGSATVLCVDKTGTLTMNKMSVRQFYVSGKFCDVNDHPHGALPEHFHRIGEFSILASHRDPFDPMEIAFKESGERYLANTEHLHADWTLVREYPLSPELLAISHVWKSPDGVHYVIAAKGAPEAIADLCHFAPEQLDDLTDKIGVMANQGLRVLGVARAYFEQGELPDAQHDFEFEFLGLVGLADPVRPTVPAALQECYTAGVRVVMITGDYPGTAQSIARQIGLTPMDEVITGPELDQLDDAALQARVENVNIFARVVPEQKLRLVNALKSAHIGIAMGGRGTDVAREAAALVLLDDDFSSIVQAIRLGRRIFDNIRKAMAYIFAIHVPIAGMSLIPVLFRLPLVLLPVHIVFMEMIIDPACSVVFEAEPAETNVMNRPPRNPRESLFGLRTIALSLLQGAVVCLIVLGVYVLTLNSGAGELEARAMTFATLIFANLGLILTNRSWTHTIVATLSAPNGALWKILFGAVVFLALALYVPFLQELFSFATLHLNDLTITLVAAVASILWFEMFKVINRAARVAEPE